MQAGALNISVWEKFVADGKVDTSKVRVFFTTPTYYDYNWTVHADLLAAQREKLAGVSGAEPRHGRGQGNPRTAARDQVRADAGRQLQGHRSRRA